MKNPIVRYNSAGSPCETYISLNKLQMLTEGFLRESGLADRETLAGIRGEFRRREVDYCSWGPGYITHEGAPVFTDLFCWERSLHYDFYEYMRAYEWFCEPYNDCILVVVPSENIFGY